MNYRKRARFPSMKLLFQRRTINSLEIFILLNFPALKKSDIGESWAFCTICSKNINIAHGGHNDYAHQVVTNSHQKFVKATAKTKHV